MQDMQHSDNATILLSEMTTQTGAVGHLILNRPNALNALNHEMILSLTKQLEAWRDDNHIHAVLITSNSEKAFCAGGDVREVIKNAQRNKHDAEQFFKDEYDLNYMIHRFNKPFIALMQGITMGGGVGIALHGSHRVATENFIFAMPETAIGFFPDIGSSALLNRCPGEIGIYLGLTGARLNVNDAYYAGLIDYHLSSHDIPDFIESLKYSDLRRESRKEISLLLEGYHQPMMHSQLSDKRKCIDHCFASDSIDDIKNRLEEEGSVFAMETLTLLNWLSPTSLEVTLKHLRSTKTQPLSVSIKQDYQLACAFVNDHDFYEGVRALLMDKDRNPTWKKDINLDLYFPNIQTIENSTTKNSTIENSTAEN